MKAIVLAAGLGTRLGLPATPKCLVEVGGVPLIERHLRALARQGVPAGSVHVVVGKDDTIWTPANQAALRSRVSNVAVNERNRTTQSTYSLLVGMQATGEEDLLVVDGDLAYPPDLLDPLLKGAGDLVLAAVRTERPGGTRLQVEGGRVLRAGEAVESDLVYAGILMIRRASYPLVMDALATGAYDSRILAFLLDDLASRAELRVAEVPDALLVNVNTQEDLARALRVAA